MGYTTRLYDIELEEFVSPIFPNGYYVDGVKPTLPAYLVEVAIIELEKPQIDEALQKVIDEWVLNLEEETYTHVWTILEKTPEEKAEYRNAEAERRNAIIDINLAKEFIRSQVVDLEINIDKYLTAYDYYLVGKSYIIGDIFRYEDELYEVIQAHTSQYDWFPNILPALYKKVRLTISQWVQPQGAHDAYQIGDKVIHNGNTWESTVNNNVWEPGVFGWTQL